MATIPELKPMTASLEAGASRVAFIRALMLCNSSLSITKETVGCRHLKYKVVVSKVAVALVIV
jgi:hypothetical protein